MKLTINFVSRRFCTSPKIQDKNVDISRAKRGFNKKQKAFLIISKEPWLKQIFFLEGERPTLITYQTCTFNQSALYNNFLGLTDSFP